jgi:hypothetical protein
MIAMTGQSPDEFKLTTVYKQADSEFSFGINQSFTLFSVINYNFNKYLNFSMCCEFLPSNIRRRRKIIKSFGVGFTANYQSVQTLMDVEEDFSDYEYDKL